MAREHGRSSAVRSVLTMLARLLAFVSLGALARLLPSGLADLPGMPQTVAVTPWFMFPATVALLLALLSRRWATSLVSLALVICVAWWQYPFFQPARGAGALPVQATRAVGAARADTTDGYARVMTFNVYKGRADASRIVAAVRDQRVEVLALQETSDDFVARLRRAGISRYLPYSRVSSSDGDYGNGLWSATPLASASTSDVNSSASLMPGGGVGFNGGHTVIRFVSVHTTAPVSGYWSRWARSIEEIGALRAHTGTRYVLMGDFNATYDHAPFRDMLGARFADAARQVGRGFTMTWPANRGVVPPMIAIDHIVVDQGVSTGQMQVLRIPGSDHAALLATLAVG